MHTQLQTHGSAHTNPCTWQGMTRNEDPLQGGGGNAVELSSQ